ncbi:hypothetical protein HG531_007461 [Fusarium graminearum]|nr:hypothetical protein HG531_007461 [Fusarium graminearum]
MFILEVIERFEGGIVFLAADKIVCVVDGAEDGEGVIQGTGGIGDILSHSRSVDQGLLLRGQLLCASSDRFVQAQDLLCQSDRFRADGLQMIDGIKKLLVAGQTNSFDLGFSVFIVST